MNEANDSKILFFPTPQNTITKEVSFDETLEAAGRGKFKKRFYAFFTDLFFIGLIQKSLVYSYFVFVNEFFFTAPGNLKETLLNNLHQMKLPTLVLTFFSYFLISLYLCHGKTLGKTLFNLRVVSHEDDPHDLSFMEAFMRTMGYTTCYVAYSVLFAIPIFRNDRRGLPDLFSQTEVLTDEEFALLYEGENANLDSDLDEEAKSANAQLDLFSA